METQNKNPWKGLKFYNEGEILYGRNDEILSLSQYIINNTQTVLYGKSGIGKSSILNAGVFPIARQQGLIPVPVRFEHGMGKSYVAQMYAAAIDAGLQVHEIVPAKDPDNECLWEFMHRQYFTKDGTSQQVQPLFVLDQFEEIFTLQTNEKERLAFFSQLADLLNDVKPSFLNDSNPDDDIDNNSDANSSEMSLNDFTFDFGDVSGNDSVSGYIEYPDYHIVFALREDFLSYLERYTSYIPVMKNNRFGLLPINEEQAAEIIRKPCPGLVDLDVAEHIIRKVTGRTDFTLDGVPEIEVDSAVLSLYLSRLFEKKPANEPKLTKELVDEFGSNIIKDFYKECIADMPDEYVNILEEQLLTKDGRRNNVSISDIKAMGIDSLQLAILIEDRKLLRKFSYGNDIRIEFIHDIICPVVRQHIADKELEQIKAQQEEQARSEHAEKRRINQRRYRNSLNPLTARGRMLIDNAVDFGEDANANTLKDSPLPCDKMQYLGRYYQRVCLSKLSSTEQMGMASISRMMGASSEGQYSTMLELRDENDNLVISDDGACKLKVQYEDNRIKSVLLKENKAMPDGSTKEINHYTSEGFCGIAFEYENGKEALRIYLDEDEQPTTTLDGYAMVRKTYDSDGNVAAVHYLGKNGEPCRHLNGNYGFISTHNDDGLEIKRVFVDENDNPTLIKSGIAGREFTYYENDTMESEYNIDIQGVRTKDKFGYASRHLQYDEQGRVALCQFGDENGQLCDTANGYCSEKTDYNLIDGQLKLTTSWLDADGNRATDKDGHLYFDIKLNSHKLPVCINKHYEDITLFESIEFRWTEYNRLFRHTEYDKYRKFAGSEWIILDKDNVYVEKFGNLNVQGVREIDNSDTFGTQVVRDEMTGLPIRLVCLGEYDFPIVCKWNYVSRNIKCENGNITEEMFLDENGNPTQHTDKIYGWRHFFNEKGLKTKFIMLDIDGSQIEDRDGDAYHLYEYDDKGRIISSSDYDINGRPHPDRAGVCKYKYSYDSNCNRSVNLDMNGNVMYADYDYVKGAYCENHTDDKGRSILYRSFDLNGDYVRLNDGVWGYKYLYDDNARTYTTIDIDKDGKIMNDKDGFARGVETYDSKDRIIMLECFNAEGKRVETRLGDYIRETQYDDVDGCIIEISKDSQGNIFFNPNIKYAIKKTYYDDLGRELKTLYFDADWNPIENGNDSYEINYTDKPYCIIVRVIDAEGNFCMASGGYYAIKRTFDSKGRVICEHYWDDKLCPMKDSRGLFGIKVLFDDETKTSKEINLDENGEPCNNYSGYAYVEKQFDDKGRTVIEYGYDVNHNLYHWNNETWGCRYDYSDPKGGVKETYLDVDGNPMETNDGYASVLTRNDFQGRKIFEMWYNMYGSPYVKQGICGHKYVYGDNGEQIDINIGDMGTPVDDVYGVCKYCNIFDIRRRLVSIKWYNANGDPVHTDSGNYGRLYQYDDDNHTQTTIYVDQNDKPFLRQDEGFAIKVETLDSNNPDRVIKEMYFDENWKPIASSLGNYGTEFWFDDDEPNVRVEVSLDENGNPHTNNQGWTYFKKFLDEYGRDYKQFLFDIEKNTYYCNNGSIGRELIYDKEGIIIGSKNIDYDGKLILNDAGYAIEIKEYDERGNATLEKHFGLDEKPVADSIGDCGLRRIFDYKNNTTRIISLDAEWNPRINSRGFAYQTIVSDDQGRTIENSYHDLDGNLVPIENGNCVERYEYFDDGYGHWRMSCSDCNDDLHLCNDNGNHYAILEVWNDESGRPIMKRLYDANMNPCAAEDGTYGFKIEYVDNSNIQIWTNIDENENPVIDKFGVAHTECTYDAYDRLMSLKNIDVDGNPIADELGNEAYTYEYSRGQYVVVCCDANFEPHNNNKGYSKKLEISDAKGERQVLYFDVNGMFVKVEE